MKTGHVFANNNRNTNSIFNELNASNHLNYRIIDLMNNENLQHNGDIRIICKAFVVVFLNTSNESVSGIPQLMQFEWCMIFQFFNQPIIARNIQCAKIFQEFIRLWKVKCWRSHKLLMLNNLSFLSIFILLGILV